jgi:hypothetical protein
MSKPPSSKVPKAAPAEAPVYRATEDEQVELLAQALLREYMHRKQFKRTLESFDAEFPRDDRTVSSRAVMYDLMHLAHVMPGMKDRGIETIMEALCCLRCEKREEVAAQAQLKAAIAQAEAAEASLAEQIRQYEAETERLVAEATAAAAAGENGAKKEKKEKKSKKAADEATAGPDGEVKKKKKKDKQGKEDAAGRKEKKPKKAAKLLSIDEMLANDDDVELARRQQEERRRGGTANSGARAGDATNGSNESTPSAKDGSAAAAARAKAKADDESNASDSSSGGSGSDGDDGEYEAAIKAIREDEARALRGGHHHADHHKAGRGDTTGPDDKPKVRSGWDGGFDADAAPAAAPKSSTRSAAAAPSKAPTATAPSNATFVPAPFAPDEFGEAAGQELLELLVGPKRLLPNSFQRQGLYRSTTDGAPAYGLEQREGGPCGVLAVVQARVIQQYHAPNGPFSGDFNGALLRAVAHTIALASGNSRAAVLVSPPTSAAWPSDDPAPASLKRQRAWLARFRQLHVPNLEADIETALRGLLPAWQVPDGPGLLCLILSVVMSRGGIAACQSDQDYPQPLIVERGYCSQDVTNLVLIGRSTSNTHNGTTDAGRYADPRLPLVPRRRLPLLRRGEGVHAGRHRRQVSRRVLNRRARVGAVQRVALLGSLLACHRSEGTEAQQHDGRYRHFRGIQAGSQRCRRRDTNSGPVLLRPAGAAGVRDPPDALRAEDAAARAAPRPADAVRRPRRAHYPGVAERARQLERLRAAIVVSQGGMRQRNRNRQVLALRAASIHVKRRRNWRKTLSMVPVQAVVRLPLSHRRSTSDYHHGTLYPRRGFQIAFLRRRT